MTSHPDIDPILSDSDACDLSMVLFYIYPTLVITVPLFILQIHYCIMILLKINTVLNTQNVLSQLSEGDLLEKIIFLKSSRKRQIFKLALFCENFIFIIFIKCFVKLKRSFYQMYAFKYR